MKKMITLLLLLVMAATAWNAAAETPGEINKAYKAAAALDEQLEILARLPEEYMDKEGSDGYEWSWNAVWVGEKPESLFPEDWEKAGYTAGKLFPEEAVGHKFIAIKDWRDIGAVYLYGNLLARLPEEMRASSLEEAEYALIIYLAPVDSGYVYNLPVQSVHEDGAAYLVDLQTGKAVRFWYERHEAKKSGTINELDGKGFTDEGIFEALRSLGLPLQ